MKIANDDFAGVPLPALDTELARAAEVGRRIAELSDPFAEVQGVTRGVIDENLREIAVPDATTDRRLTPWPTH